MDNPYAAPLKIEDARLCEEEELLNREWIVLKTLQERHEERLKKINARRKAIKTMLEKM